MSRDAQRLSDYFKVDLQIGWKTIQADLAPLHALVAGLRKGLPE